MITVAIVTSCSSTQGAAICRALLNTNAFVLGIDREVPHESTQSSKASHFQFLKSSALDVDEGEAILKAVSFHFKTEGPPDFLVHVVREGDGKGELGRMKSVLDGMSVRGKGLVLVTVEGEGEEEVVSYFHRALWLYFSLLTGCFDSDGSNENCVIAVHEKWHSMECSCTSWYVRT